ncbi:MAG: hypothetical protein FJ217_01385 [Ignavibacteria bacterium]|nr:hypothetical protein [Ignavibacteria bacterium]
MKIDWGFMRLVSYCAIAVAVVIAYPLSSITSREIVQSVIAGGLASLLHLLLGYAAIEVGFEKPNTTFLKIILGGTVIRLLLLVGIVLLLVKVFAFHTLSLMISLLFFYMMNLALEIHLLQKKVSLKN